MIDTLIIGCGAAGAAAAIAAAEVGQSVTVLDRNRKPLKKLGVTGNGRGNLMNAGEPRYYGNTHFAEEVLAAMPYGAVRHFWEALGVTLTEEDEGRIYPAACMASVATDALLRRMGELKVRLMPNAMAEELRADGQGFQIDAIESVFSQGKVKPGGKQKKGELLEQRRVSYQARRVIVAAGGKAAAAHGTDGSAYRLLQSMGHSVVELRPALCPLLTEAGPIRGLAGHRVRAELRLYAPEGSLLHQTRGEALFAEDGVSGIAAMQLARFAQAGCTLTLDMREAVFGDPAIDVGEALNGRIKQHATRPLGQLLIGATAPDLSETLFRAAGLKELERPSGELNAGELAALVEAITAFTLRVQGTRGFDAAQVTAGGVACANFNPLTMESRLVSGLYAAGEILDVDGDCGGYNLMFAVAGGLLAGRASR